MKLGLLSLAMPRALTAPDMENVNGTWGHEHRNLSVLQQHAAFFDQNNDGIIYPLETYRGIQIGFWKLGFFFCFVYVNTLVCVYIYICIGELTSSKIAGFRSIGFNVVFSLLFMIFIHAVMSYATLPVSLSRFEKPRVKFLL